MSQGKTEEKRIDQIERFPFFSHQFEEKKTNSIERCPFVNAASPQNWTERSEFQP
jgi:hypothetical protein